MFIIKFCKVFLEFIRIFSLEAAFVASSNGGRTFLEDPAVGTQVRIACNPPLSQMNP